MLSANGTIAFPKSAAGVVVENQSLLEKRILALNLKGKYHFEAKTCSQAIAHSHIRNTNTVFK